MERSGAAHNEAMNAAARQERLRQGKNARDAEQEWAGDLASQEGNGNQPTSKSGRFEVVKPPIDSSPEIQKIKAKIEAEERAAKSTEQPKTASLDRSAPVSSKERKHDVLMRSDNLRENAVKHFVAQLKEKSATQPFAAELKKQLEMRMGEKGIDTTSKIDLLDILLNQAEDEQKYAIVVKVLDQLGKMQ